MTRQTLDGTPAGTADVEHRLRTTLRAVAGSTPVPPVPAVLPGAVVPLRRRRHGTRAALVGGVAALLLPVTGLGVAAATGNLPVGLSLFGLHDEAAVVGTERLGSIPGPDGGRFELWVATRADGSRCLLDGREGDSSPGATLDGGGGGMCLAGDGAAGGAHPFGDMVSTSREPGRDVVEFQVGAGDAVRAEVTLPDGTRLPTVVGEGMVFGWFPADVSGEVTVTGYDAAGREVGRERLDDRFADAPRPGDPVPEGVPTVSPDGSGAASGSVHEEGGPEGAPRAP